MNDDLLSDIDRISNTSGGGAADAGDIDAGESGDDDEAWMPADGEDDDDVGRTSAPRVSPEQALRKECGHSQLHVDDLKAHRHQITRAYLAGGRPLFEDHLVSSGPCSLTGRLVRSSPGPTNYPP